MTVSTDPIYNEIWGLFERTIAARDFYRAAVSCRAFCGLIPYRLAAQLPGHVWDTVSAMGEREAFGLCKVWLSEEPDEIVIVG